MFIIYSTPRTVLLMAFFKRIKILETKLYFTVSDIIIHNVITHTYLYATNGYSPCILLFTVDEYVWQGLVILDFNSDEYRHFEHVVYGNVTDVRWWSPWICVQRSNGALYNFHRIKFFFVGVNWYCFKLRQKSFQETTKWVTYNVIMWGTESLISNCTHISIVVWS